MIRREDRDGDSSDGRGVTVSVTVANWRIHLSISATVDSCAAWMNGSIYCALIDPGRPCADQRVEWARTTGGEQGRRLKSLDAASPLSDERSASASAPQQLPQPSSCIGLISMSLFDCPSPDCGKRVSAQSG